MPQRNYRSDSMVYRSEHASYRTTDTVVVGNGPAALFLSFLLHGNVPKYDSTLNGPHPDPVLHAKLSKFATKPLYCALRDAKAVEELTEHFSASNLSYSNQALPVNVLLDTLVRPNADTEIGETKSRIRWDYDPLMKVNHIVLGSAPVAGGQWTEDPVSTNWDIGTLSYAEMFSLPGYSFAEHYKQTYKKELPESIRPSRRDVSSYFAAYPKVVGISSGVFSSSYVQRICRSPQGFFVRVHRPKTADTYIILCKHLVLATGIFSHIIPPPPIFLPILSPHPKQNASAPLLVVGSGFTAADVILSQKEGQKVIHLYRWNEARPSPLKGCHPQAYPDYAQIYRHMKLAAIPASTMPTSPPPKLHGDPLRDWDATYEGFPNAQVVSISNDGVVQILLSTGEVILRQVSGLKYCVGRRGSLEYLAPDLRKEVGVVDAAWVSADTMRRRVEVDFEVAKTVFVVGSLTGDSLVRYGFGGCVLAAGCILRDARGEEKVTGGIDRGVGLVVQEKRASWGKCVVS